MSLCHDVIVTLGLRPPLLVGLADPAVAMPSRDDLDDGVARHGRWFQGRKVVSRERRRQLIKDRCRSWDPPQRGLPSVPRLETGQEVKFSS